MNLIKVALPLFLSMLAGCTQEGGAKQRDPLAMWSMDNPKVRKLQKEETVKYVPEASTRRHLQRTIGSRVGVIVRNAGSGTVSRNHHGRAVAITSDGYYLTANHVILDRPFFLRENVLKKKRKPGPYKGADWIKDKHYAGRLVWSDPSLDLAIVKFDRTNVPHFRAMRMQAETGELVYTADDEGSGALPPPDKKGRVHLGDFVGDGSFFAAGKVVSSEPRGLQSKAMGHLATLVSRGAMSGSPLVTADEKLCGIIVAGRFQGRQKWFRRPQIVSQTYASMIEPAFILEKIRQDRASSRRR